MLKEASNTKFFRNRMKQLEEKNSFHFVYAKIHLFIVAQAL